VTVSWLLSSPSLRHSRMASRRAISAAATATVACITAAAYTVAFETKPSYARAERASASSSFVHSQKQSQSPRLRPGYDTKTEWQSDWDGRESESASRVTRVLWLVRHGQATEEIEGEDDGARRLTPLGRAQAKAAAARLKALIHGSTDEENASSSSESSSKARVRVMIHSTMVRAKETADIIAAEAFPNVKREANALIREGAPVRPVPDTWRQKEHVHVTDAPRIEAGFRSIFFRRTARDVEQDDAKGEKSSSSSASASRTEEHEIIVCHGNVIRYSVLRALQLPPDAWLRIGLYNGSITRVEIRPDGGVSLRCLGEAGHMRAPDQLTHN